MSGILSTNSVMIPVAPVALPMPENVSVVGKSDGTRKDESPTSITGTGTSITSRRLVTLLSDESATVDILCRTSRMERVGACCEQRDPELIGFTVVNKEILKLIGFTEQRL